MAAPLSFEFEPLSWVPFVLWVGKVMRSQLAVMHYGKERLKIKLHFWKSQSFSNRGWTENLSIWTFLIGSRLKNWVWVQNELHFFTKKSAPFEFFRIFLSLITLLCKMKKKFGFKIWIFVVLTVLISEIKLRRRKKYLHLSK